jgi:EAL and modified HD-GYP domain-containing signal transduction protein
LYGYELLYRRDALVGYADGDRDAMSADVLAGGILGLGLQRLTDGSLAFLNFSRLQLINESWTLFEPGSVVIELLETVEPGAETLDACRRLVRAGHTLALDDYVHSEARAPLLDLASIVKVDVLNRSPAELEGAAKPLASAGVRLLAERVENAVVRDICVAIGFDLFQGYLFSKPETLTNADLGAAQLATIRLLNLVQDPNTTDRVIETAFASDLALTYKLLRIVNTASIGGRGITSIGHAVQLVGRQALHRWLALILVASLGRKGDVTQELALTAITRARMCELLVSDTGSSRTSGSAFVVGLLSLLDVLLEVPMDRILGHLSLSPEVTSALVGRRGPLGTPLRVVESYENAEWDTALSLAASGALANDRLPSLYIDALTWAAAQVAQT